MRPPVFCRAIALCRGEKGREVEEGLAESVAVSGFEAFIFGGCFKKDYNK
jgi:hypothetical protein